MKKDKTYGQGEHNPKGHGIIFYSQLKTLTPYYGEIVQYLGLLTLSDYFYSALHPIKVFKER